MSSETLSLPFVKTSKQEPCSPRIPVAEVERFFLPDLAPAERAKLIDDAYAISIKYFPDNTREFFARAFFSGDEAWAFVYRGADGARCGFAALSILRVSHEGKEQAVVKGTIVVDTRYKLALRPRMAMLLEAVLWKLRNPGTPIGYMGGASSPSVYRLLATSVPRMYPSRHAETPDTIKALVTKATRMRGCPCVDEDKLLVRATSRHGDPERIRAARSLQDDPDARFYMEQNPRFEDLYLLVWVPLDVRNVAGGIVKTLGRHLFGGERG